jgi:DMSO/TMAO reductase YedYZ molybdopterin-dependent catalytic subunit
MLQFTKFNRLIVAGIAAAAITPTAALASPATDVGGTAPQTQDNRAPDQVAPAAPGTGVVPQDNRAPDQVAPGSKDVKPEPVAPTWPVNPQPIVNAAPSATSTDDGLDDGVLIAIGAGAVLLVGGIGLAGRKRLRIVRQRQLAA